MKRTLLALAGALLSLSGCTELEVRKMPDGVIQGIPYTLPKKIFLVTVEYELRECAAGVDGQRKFFTLAINKNPGIVAAVEPDEKERYYIPYSSLRNWFKNTNVTVDSHPNQTLSGVSVTVDDKTGDAITAAVGSMIRIAAVGSGFRVQSQSEETRAYCSATVLEALRQIKAIEAKGPAAQTPQDAADLARLKRDVTHKDFHVWSPVKPSKRSEPPATMSLAMYPDRLLGKEGKWVTEAGLAALKSLNPGAFRDGKLVKLATTLSLDFQTALIPDPEELPKGFRLRQGPIGLLRVCDGTCPAQIGGDATDILKAEEHVIPQLGQYVIMPLKNRLFENQTLTIGVAADGAITKLGLKSDASAAAAFNTLNTNLDAITKAREAHEKAKADARNASLNAVKDNATRVAAEQNAIAECLKAQKALREAGGIPSGSCQ